MDPEKIKPAVYDGTAELSESDKFWGNPKHWPREPSEYVFLANAVHDIGQARFGSEWTFDEPVVNAPRNTVVDREHAEKILTLRQPGFVWDKAAEAANLSAAKDIIAAKIADAKPKLERVVAVWKIIATACEDEKLTSATRARAGGPMLSMKPHAWSTDRLHYRFQFCQIDPADLYGENYRTDLVDGAGYFVTREPRDGDHRLIFLTRKSLDAFVADLKRSSTSLAGSLEVPRNELLPVEDEGKAIDARADAPPKPTRHREPRGDEDFLRQLKLLGVEVLRLYPAWPRCPDKMRSVAKNVASSLAPETIRKIISGRHPRSKRLAQKKLIDAWWSGPIASKPPGAGTSRKRVG